MDVVAQGARGDPAQQSQPAPVVEEVGTQALRERQHQLAVRDRGEQALIKPQASLGQPPRVTRREEVAPLAAQRHQELGPAGRAAHPGEAVLEQAAIQEGRNPGTGPTDPRAAARPSLNSQNSGTS